MTSQLSEKGAHALYDRSPQECCSVACGGSTRQQHWQSRAAKEPVRAREEDQCATSFTLAFVATRLSAASLQRLLSSLARPVEDPTLMTASSINDARDMCPPTEHSVPLNSLNLATRYTCAAARGVRFLILVQRSSPCKIMGTLLQEFSPMQVCSEGSHSRACYEHPLLSGSSFRNVRPIAATHSSLNGVACGLVHSRFWALTAGAVSCTACVALGAKPRQRRRGPYSKWRYWRHVDRSLPLLETTDDSYEDLLSQKASNPSNQSILHRFTRVGNNKLPHATSWGL
eukprot:1493432-Amphidinium_carterae.1